MPAKPALFACALALGASMACAEDSGEPAAGPRLATREDYLACLKMNADVGARKSRWAESDSKYKEHAKKFQAAEADLAAQLKKHMPSTKAEIESYNRAVASRNTSAQSLNGEGAALQQEQAALNKLVVEANIQCGSLLVSPEVARAAEEEFRKTTARK